jgi:phage-related minor tail protein
MPSATVGALRVTLGLDSAAFTDGLSAAQKHLQGVGRQMQSIGTTMAAVGTGLTATVTAPILALGNMAVAEASEMRDALGQVNAALTSMGNVGGRTLEQLKAQADRLAGSSLFEDDQILRGVTANLLTFGNIAGASFDRAQQAAVDLSARLGQDLQASAIMVGKALNDPTRGLAALRRVGIQFTADQEAQIKAMQAVGNTAGAQAIMLGELERQFGGSAKAARDAANPMERVRLAFAAMAGDIGAILLPVVDKFAAVLSDLASRFGQLSPSLQQVVVVIAGLAAALGPLLIVMGALVASVAALLPVIGAIGAPLLAFAAAAAAVGVALYVFRDDLIPIMQSFGRSIQENIGPKLAPLWEALKGAVAAVGEVFSAIFGDGSPGSASETLKMWGEIVSRTFGAAIDIITGAINVITNILKALGALLRGDFSAMWGYLGQAVMSAVRGIANAFQTLFPEVVSWVRQTYEGVKAWLLDRFTALVTGIIDRIRSVGRAFYELYDKVVGHSYIPDLVIAIADWMGPRLQDAMAPVYAITSDTAAAFDGMAQDIDSSFDGILKSLANKDWKGALSGAFDFLKGQGGGLGKFGDLGKALMGFLPGFKTGGTFKVGGNGGIDSSLVAFRATPGEMVDVRRPGQGLSGDGRMQVEVLLRDEMLDARVVQVAGPIVGAGVAIQRAESNKAARSGRRRFV